MSTFILRAGDAELLVGIAVPVGSGESNAAANVGGAEEVFRDIIAGVLNFRTLDGPSPLLTVATNGDVIEFSVTSAAPSQGIGAGNLEGSATDVARADHDHAIRESGGQDLTMGAVADGEVLTRSGTTIIGTAPGGAPVDSVFGRTGPVVAQASDYDANQVDFSPDGDIAATDVQAAVVEVRDDTDTKLTGKLNTSHEGAGGSVHALATSTEAGFFSPAEKIKLSILETPDTQNVKQRVRLLTDSANIVLLGSQTIDGVVTTPGDRVGVFGQTNPAEDGLYDTSAGAWTRTADFPNGSSQACAIILVGEGVTNADALFKVINDPPNDVVGTDDLVVGKFSQGSPLGAGAGLVLSGNDLDVVAGDGSIVVSPNDIAVGVISDVQHGTRGGGNQHALATSTEAGFFSSADFNKLAGIAPGAEENTIDSFNSRTGAVIPQASDYDANQVDFSPDGDIASTDVQAAVVEVRDDTDTKLTGKLDTSHEGAGGAVHAAVTGGANGFMIAADKTKLDGITAGGAPGTIEPDDAAQAGSATAYAREDHQHAIAAAAPSQGVGAGNTEGSSTSFARADHDHTIRESGGQDLTMGAVADGEILVRSGTTIVGQAVGGGAPSVLQWGNNSVSGTNTTRYLTPGHDGTAQTNNDRQIPMPRAGTLQNLFIEHNTPAGNGGSVFYTVLVNGVATAITTSLASTAASASDISNTVAVVAGDLVSIEVSKISSIGSGNLQAFCTLELA